MNRRLSSSARFWPGTAVAILLAAFALRFVALDDFPPGLRYDELQNYVMAGRVLAGERPIYFAESWGHEPLYHYVQAASLALAGASDWALRLPSALFGLLTVGATGLAGQMLFGRRVGWLAAGLLAVSFWAVFYSRVGLRVGAAALFAALLAICIWLAITLPPARKWAGWAAAVLGGAAIAGGMYTYLAGRVLPGLVVGAGLHLALLDRQKLRQVWLRLLVMLLIGAGLSAPLFLYLRANPQDLQRIALLYEALDALRAGDPLPVLDLSWRAFGMFVWQGERDWLYNVDGRPIFELPLALFFLLGVGVALFRWRKPAAALLFIWLTVGVLPSMVAPPAASVTHSIVAQPAAYLLLALGIDWVWRRIPARAGWAGTALAVGLLIGHGVWSAYDFFGVWSNQPEVLELYQGGVTAVADTIDWSDTPVVAVGGPYVNYWHPWNAVAFELAAPADTREVRWFNPAGGWVWPAQGPASVFFPTDPLGAQQYDAALLALFQADAVLMGETGRFAHYQLAETAVFDAQLAQTTAATQLAWPPDLAALPAPQPPLAFADRLALLAAAVRTPDAAPGDVVQFVTYWQALRADPAPLVAFAHLTTDGVDIWGQQDWLDVRMAGLQPGDRFAQVHTVTVNADAPPGAYHLQVGLYGPDTQLRLPAADGRADRVWVGEVTIK